jgi:hypothetical protein
MLVYFMAIWNILRLSGIFYGHMVIWFISPRFGILYLEKSGNPDIQASSASWSVKYFVIQNSHVIQMLQTRYTRR